MGMGDNPSAIDADAGGFDVMEDMWTAGSAPGPIATPQGVSFALPPDAVVDPPPVWRLQLPSDPVRAAANLHSISQGLRVSDAALVDAEARMQEISARAAGGSAGLEGVSFDINAAPLPSDPAEMELMQMLREADGHEPTISFETAGEGSGDWREATKQFLNFLQTVERFVVHYAWVETQVEDRLLARTIVSWTGDMRTLWPTALAQEERLLHMSSLDLALRSRAAMQRTLTVVVAGAAKLALLLTTPIGAVMALPAAWKYIKQVRKELNKHPSFQ